jgi:hypothetical protein
MAKVYVYIEATVVPDGKDAKDAIKPDVKAKLEKAAAKAIADGVPSKQFSTKDSDKPKTKGKPNAVKITATIKIKATPGGSKTKVEAEAKLVFEAIAWPKTTGGSLLGAASQGAGVEEAGDAAKVIADRTGDLLDAILPDLVKSTMSGSKFKKQAEGVGLEIE